MKRIFLSLLVLIVVVTSLTFAADDGAVDKHIADLKSSDPAVRAKAAFDLGCG